VWYGDAEIDVGSEIAGDVEIEQSVAIEVEPHGAVRVHPAPQARLGGHIREPAVAEVVQQLRVAPLVDEQVLEAIVVVVAPDGAHRHAFAGAVERRHTRCGGHIAERAVRWFK